MDKTPSYEPAFKRPAAHFAHYCQYAKKTPDDIAAITGVEIEKVENWLHGTRKIPYRHFAVLQSELSLSFEQTQSLIFAYHPHIQALDNEWLIEQPSWQQEQLILHALRLRAGMTQRQLAEHAGIDVVKVAEWEKGYKHPSLEELKQVALPILDPGNEREEQNLIRAHYNKKLFLACGGKICQPEPPVLTTPKLWVDHLSPMPVPPKEPTSTHTQQPYLLLKPAESDQPLEKKIILELNE